MNIITRYKKTILSAMVLVAMNMGAAEAPKCTPCQAAAAARQSARDAAAAVLLLAGKPIAREIELDTNLGAHDASRAPREELVNLCNTCDICEEEVTCPVEATNCCDVVNFVACQVLRQGRDARKCCKKIKHELREIEELVGDFDATAVSIAPCAVDVVDAINATEADVIAWLKGLAILIAGLYPCIQ